MIREIVKMPLLLQQPSEPATAEDVTVAQDLVDTLLAHADHCVGLAANMIGVRKRVIVVGDKNGKPLAMLNPVIVAKTGEYATEEGCLSLVGVRPTTRYRQVTVEYLDMSMRPKKGTFSGVTAQAIQHEIDHCNGIVI